MLLSPLILGTTWTLRKNSIARCPLETREEAGVKLQFWVIDGKVRGFRFPAFSAEELEKRAEQVGRKFADDQESREMGNVDLRLEYMDRDRRRRSGAAQHDLYRVS